MAATHPTIPVSSFEKQHERGQEIDKGLPAILEVLNSVTATRVPLIQSGFSSAARIFEISQKVRTNQDEFVEFAEEGCRLIYSISLKLADKQELEPNLKTNLEELLATLQSIEAFGEKYSARGTVKAILLFVFDIYEIRAQRRRLELCMRLFEFESLLELREKTNELIEQHGQNGGVYGGGTGHRNTNPENNNNRVNNSISFGSVADFSGTTSLALGANSVISVNSGAHHLGLGDNFSGSTGIAFGANSLLNVNSGAHHLSSPVNSYHKSPNRPRSPMKKPSSSGCQVT